MLMLTIIALTAEHVVVLVVLVLLLLAVDVNLDIAILTPERSVRVK